MSTDSRPDLFALGWRYVAVPGPDGTTTQEMIPLTLEDLLHPEEGDVIVQNTAHDRDLVYLREVFHRQLDDRPDARVFCDLRVEWGVEGMRHHSPDLAVVFGVETNGHELGSYEVGTDGPLPTLVVEVVSPLSRSNDVDVKVRHYHQAQVPRYVIVDRDDLEGPVRLIGYRYEADGYVEEPLDEAGRLAVPDLGLLLGGRDTRVVAWDARTGQELGDYVAVTRQLEEADRQLEAVELRLRDESRERARAEERADDAAAARQVAESARQQAESARLEAEAALLEAEAARLEAEREAEQAKRDQRDAERHRQDAERQRQELERNRDEERRQREALEFRLAEMAERLRQLGANDAVP